MSAADKVVSLAISQIGYHEKASNSGLYTNSNNGSGNWNKFAYEIDQNYKGYFNGSKNGYEWCTSFVSWCFLKNFGLEKTHKMMYTPANSLAAGCVYAVQYFKNNGAYYSKPQVGDQWFAKDSSGEASHTGIVVSVNGSKFDVVEGNKNNQVERNTYNVGGTTTHGFGRPKWSVAEQATTYTEGWVKDSNGWWYRYKDGSYPKNCWKKINDKWYWFDTEGYVVASQWKLYNGKAYYLGADGAMVVNKSLKINENGELTYSGNYYHLLKDCTYEVYRKTLDKLISKGVLKGEGGSGENLILNLSEDAVREFVVLDRAGVFG